MKIITGKTGTNHVTSADDRSLHAATFGTGSYVLDVGDKFSTSILSSNSISISSGDLLHNGTHARIPYGSTEQVTIDNGTTGYNRKDLIVARYKLSSNIESMELVVIKGEPTTGTPVEPSYTKGNILEGVTESDMPLYCVTLSGVNISTIETKFVIKTSLDDRYTKQEVKDLISKEVTDRNAAIKSSVNSEATARNTAITNAINTEVTNRNTAITNAINTEVTNRNAAIDSSIKQLTVDIQVKNQSQDQKISYAKTALNKAVSCLNSVSNGFTRIGKSTSWDDLATKCTTTSTYIDNAITELKDAISRI